MYIVVLIYPYSIIALYHHTFCTHRKAAAKIDGTPILQEVGHQLVINLPYAVVSRIFHSPCNHDDVIKWKHFPRYWPLVRGIHRSPVTPVNSTHKGQWRGALILSLICVWTNAWVNNRDAGDLRRYRAHYDVMVMTHWGWDKIDAILQTKFSNEFSLIKMLELQVCS